jgi:hypothetical protein
MLDFHPAVEVTKESTWFVFNMALVNNFPQDVWAEECSVMLSRFDGIPSSGHKATCKGVLGIREFVKANETIRIGLCQTVYAAAGCPQDEYSFIISGTLKYRMENVWYSQPFEPRRIRMCGPHPIEARGAKRSFDGASQKIQEPAYSSLRD